jgi:hypothetical protein
LGLSNKYTVAFSRIPDLFAKIRDGQAPDVLSIQLLKDWGFTSSNDRALLQVLKELGFLSPDGKPTPRYHEYRDHSRSKAVMAQALRDAYGDLFLIKEHPTEADKAAIQGKFKSFHNVSDNLAAVMTKNFFALLGLADLGAAGEKRDEAPKANEKQDEGGETPRRKASNEEGSQSVMGGLHYNIQIHLPATKDVEVYNAIFKSLRDHLVDE